MVETQSALLAPYKTHYVFLLTALAGGEGYIAVEGYSVIRDQRFEWDNAGPVRLYEKAGFVKAAVQGQKVVMRKDLK